MGEGPELPGEAGRYGDLAHRCEDRAASAPAVYSTPAEADAPLPPWPAAPSPGGLHFADADASGEATSEPEVEIGGEDAANEIDLSEEWDGALSGAAASVEPAIEEVPNEAEIEPAVEEISAESTDAVTETIE